MKHSDLNSGWPIFLDWIGQKGREFRFRFSSKTADDLPALAGKVYQGGLQLLD